MRKMKGERGRKGESEGGRRRGEHGRKKVEQKELGRERGRRDGKGEDGNVRKREK